MSCRKALELDLAAYLAEPDGGQWEEFRAHYPGCAECSKELAIWTRLETSMRSTVAAGAPAHPSSELLAQFDEGPRALSPEQWQQVDGHVRECHRCADQLAALQQFDFAALEAAVPSAPGQGLRAVARSAAAFLRRLLPARSSPTAEALQELLPWGQPEFALQSQGGPGADAARAVASAPVAVLAAVRGELTGEVYRIFAGENRVGRAAGCEVRIPSDALSRVEARLTAEADCFELLAVHERSPVLVNGTAMRSGPLRDGDFVELGGLGFQFRTIASS